MISYKYQKQIKIFLSIIFFCSFIYLPLFVAGKKINVSTPINRATQYLILNGIQNDWDAVVVRQAGKVVPKSYLLYKKNELNRLNGEYRNITDYEKSILGISAAGENPCYFCGCNLLSKVVNSKNMIKQGLNGIAYALIALDCQKYSLPENSYWTRERLTQELLDRQNKDGGWGLNHGEKSSVDTTSMALIALAPYKPNQKIQLKANKAIQWLSHHQLDSGGFISWDEEGSESASQVLLALSSWGVSPDSDMFTKQKGNVLTYLLSFQRKSGGFSHLKGEIENHMSTTQALQALISYDYFLKGKGLFYQFSKIKDKEKVNIVTIKNLRKILVDNKAKSSPGKSIQANNLESKKDENIENEPSSVTQEKKIHNLKKGNNGKKHPSPKSGSGWVIVGGGLFLMVVGIGIIWWRRVRYT